MASYSSIVSRSGASSSSPSRPSQPFIISNSSTKVSSLNEQVDTVMTEQASPSTPSSLLDYSLPNVRPLPRLSKPKPKLSIKKPPTKANELGLDDYDLMDDGVISDDDNTLDDPYDVFCIESLKLKEKTLASLKADPTNHSLTANGAPTFRSTNDPRLDFFFEVLKGTHKETVHRLLEASWKKDNLTTLKLIFQLRSILHGKGERQEFYHCLEWLKLYHRQTLVFNLRFIKDHGYWKDLVNWLVYEVSQKSTDEKLFERDAERLERQKTNLVRKQEQARKRLQASQRPQKRSRVHRGVRVIPHVANTTPALAPGIKLAKEFNKMNLDRETINKFESLPDNMARAQERNRLHSIQAAQDRKNQCQQRYLQARVQFKSNAQYWMLHVEVARLFANALVRDKQNLLDYETRLNAVSEDDDIARSKVRKPHLSLVAKWCPSLLQFHDKHTLICTTIAQILFPIEDYPIRQDESRAVYINRIRQLLRTEYYVPLRKSIPVLETFMSSQEWNQIPYNRVPAKAMKNCKSFFEKYDHERFSEFLGQVSKGETTIAAAALMPHELVQEAYRSTTIELDPLNLKVQTLEAQWKSYLERLASVGNLQSCMAMCDVSGSMTGEPMDVAIALSLLVSSLCSSPLFKDKILTFESQPKMHVVNRNQSFVNQVRKLQQAPWGGSTNLQAAFDRILQDAKESKCLPKDMVKTLFVFSDMEFNSAVETNRKGIHSGSMHKKTNFDVAKTKFLKAGYALPQIVFWNLAAKNGSGAGNKPALATEGNVAMVSGFSGMMLKLFLGGEDLLKVMDPVKILEKSIAAKEFEMLKVLD